MQIADRCLAVFLSACLVWVSPGISSYQAFALGRNAKPGSRPLLPSPSAVPAPAPHISAPFDDVLVPAPFSEAQPFIPAVPGIPEEFEEPPLSKPQGEIALESPAARPGTALTISSELLKKTPPIEKLQHFSKEANPLIAGSDSQEQARDDSAHAWENSRLRRNQAQAPVTAQGLLLETDSGGANLSSQDSLRFFFVRQGGPPLLATENSLPQTLTQNPELVASLNEKGRVRVILGGRPEHRGLGKEDLPLLTKTLGKWGLTAPVEAENIPIDWQRKALQEQAGPRRRVEPALPDRSRVPIVTPLLREAAYLARTFAASLTQPTWSEVTGGLLSKGPAFLFSVTWWSKLLLPSHPAALAVALTLSLILEAFHGLWINTWQNLQNNIAKQRGLAYQTLFNLSYMQGTAALFRIIAWSAIAGTIAPWQIGYWRDMGIMVLAGTFFGTLGYQGLNELYNKGRIPRWTRSAMQQARDFLFLIAGPLFATGSMDAFWILFSISQTIDLSLYWLGRRTAMRPILYISDPHVASTKEFQDMYPVGPESAISPVRQALQAVKNSPPLRLASLFLRRIAPSGEKAPPDSLAQAILHPDPNRPHTPSPEDWRDEILYSVMIDRFARGPGAKPLGEPADGGSRHGGNLSGLTRRLDYIRSLGVTALMLSPVTQGLPEAYHGYAPDHLLAVDPHLGTMTDFERLVREAHRRGIRVIMDLIINHVGPVFEYQGSSRWAGLEAPPKEIVWTREIKPVELARQEHFSRRGVIDDWNHPEQVLHGDFPPNYRNWAMERSDTQAALIHVALWWIQETDIDGFRLDAVRHMDPSFLKRFTKEIREFAAGLGKKNFLLLGENSTGIDAEVADDLKSAGLGSAYNYPDYRRVNHALHGRAPTLRMEESSRRTLEALGAVAGRLVRFIDNHDVYRFLRVGEPLALLKTAFAFLLFSTGTPMVYYGTEQAFRQAVDRLAPEDLSLPADPGNREDMFPEGGFKSSSSQGDKFDPNSETYRWVRRLADLRRRHPALRRGEQWVRWSDPQGPGLYAFSRIHEGEEVVVLLNTAPERRAAVMWVDASISPAGTEFEDVLGPGYVVRAQGPPEGSSQIAVDVPPYGVRLLVRRAAP